MDFKKEFYICKVFSSKFLWRAMFRAIFFRKKTIFYYLAIAPKRPLLDKCRCFINRIVSKRISVEKFPFDALEMLNEEGESIVIKASLNSLGQIMDRVDAQYFDDRHSVFHHLNKSLSSVKEDLKIWINFHVALDIFDYVLLVDIVEWLLKNPSSGLQGSDVRLILEKKYHWANLVRDYARARNVSVVFTYHRKPADKSLFLNMIYCFTNVFVSWCGSLFIDRKKNVESTENTICAFNDGAGDVAEFYNSKNYCLFWFPYSQINPPRIVLYNSNFLKVNNVASAVKTGFNMVSGERLFKKINKGIMRYRCSFNALRFYAGYVRECLRLLCKVRGKSSYECWAYLNILLFRLPFWQDFFKNMKVKIFFKPGAVLSYRDIAAKLAGAATVSYQTSNLSHATVGHADSCDVFFIWGDEYRKVFGTKYSRIQNEIQSGYIFDYVFKGLDEKAKRLREEFAQKGARFILSLFDESLALNTNGLVFLSNVTYRKKAVSLYWSFFLYALDHKDVGIIIKPKKAWNKQVLKSCPETSGLIDQLEKEGRLRFFDAEQFPSDAGKASDLAVGFMSDSTAALECWLAGVPAIFYDITGSKYFNPHYRLGLNKIIFEDSERMFNSIDLFRKDKDFCAHFGNMSNFVNHKDPFRDGQANKRIGTYLKQLMEYMDLGLPKQDAILKANEIYIKMYGPEKIFVN